MTTNVFQTTGSNVSNNAVNNPNVVIDNTPITSEQPKTEVKKDASDKSKATDKPKAGKQKDNTETTAKGKAKDAKTATDTKKEVKKETKVTKQKAKAVKIAARDKKLTDYTLADAKTRLRDSGKESKTLSGAVKIIHTFWKDGYKDAFAFLKLEAKDIQVPKIQSLWSDKLKIDGVFAYKTKVAIFTKNQEGERIYEYDADGKKVYKEVLKEFTGNFTPLKIFEAMLYAQLEKGVIKF